MTLAEVRFVDTSILLEILRVPGKAQRVDEVREELRRLTSSGVPLVLPIATVIETGNHIAQVQDGHGRRLAAERFVTFLRATVSGTVPWVFHAVEWDKDMLSTLCEGTAATGPFVELAAAGLLGTGDLAILAECERYARRTFGLDVRVWTLDVRRAAYAN